MEKEKRSEYIYCIHCNKTTDITKLNTLAQVHPICVFLNNYRLNAADAMNLFLLNYENDITIASKDNIEYELLRLGLLVS